MVTNDNQTLVCDRTSAKTTKECLNLGLTTAVCTVTAVLHQEKQIERLHPKPFLLIKCAKLFGSLYQVSRPKKVNRRQCEFCLSVPTSNHFSGLMTKKDSETFAPGGVIIYCYLVLFHVENRCILSSASRNAICSVGCIFCTPTVYLKIASQMILCL